MTDAGNDAMTDAGHDAMTDAGNDAIVDAGPIDPTTRCRDFGPLRAFPGVEGFGASTRGGRGGQVIYVDNLNDSGEGSLRAAVETVGPRTVVFSVSGTILLQSTLRIQEPFITIAGHSAPGGGIALRTADTVTSPAIVSNADEVIIQHLRVRPGASTELSNSVDAITVTGGSHIVLANTSFSWAVDENINLWFDASDFTMQECISSEGLFNSTHTYEAPHSKGFIAGPDNARMSLIRNLFASNDDRNPLLQSAHPYELVNNVIYNGYQVGTQLSLEPGAQVNLVGNIYLPGPNYRPSRYQVIARATTGFPLLDGAIYVSDNISPRSDPADDWAVMGWSGIHSGDYNGSPLPETVRAALPFTMSDVPVTAIPASELLTRLLPSVGASLPARDSVDTRIIADVQNGTGGLIDTVDEVGGWPALAAGEPLVDADRDGLPDAWEAARGLDPANASDSVSDRDDDGYTNLEEYLACL